MSKIKSKAAAYEKSLAKLNAYKAKHAKVVEGLIKLESEVSDALEELKTLAKEKAGDHETEVLHDTPTLHVEVRPSYNAPIFSPARAKKYWPTEYFEQCRKVIIDNKEVDALVKSGVLNDRELKKALKEPQTLRQKAVYVKVI